MTKSKLSSRCRPGLGTLIRVQVDDETLIELIYSRLAAIEAIFNFHEPKSEISRFNQNRSIKTSTEWKTLFCLANEIRRQSKCGFTPYVEEQSGERFENTENLRVDLGGLAKGFAVDQAIETALKINPSAQGFVEAGGDIRYFGQNEATVTLRLGIPPHILTRELRLSGTQMAIASSAPGLAAHFGDSRTTLHAFDWPPGTSVSVVAEDCATADALTKVILFGGPELFEVWKSKAQAFIFDAQGNLL